MKTDIAIIGVSIKIAGIANLEAFGNFLENSETAFNSLSEVRQKDIFDRFGKFEVARGSYLERIDLFDNTFFKIANAEAERIDPEQRLMLEGAVKAVNNAGYLIKELKGQRIGIFHTIVESQYSRFFDDGSNLSLSSHMPGMVGTRVANFMDWRGPVIGVDTTCSSSLTALYYACQSIAIGDCNMALVGGVSLSVSSKQMVENLPIISKKEHCLPFDEDADGTLGGEGVFCLFIRKAADAIRDNDPIYAIIKGGAINHGGELIQNISAPSPISQSDVIKMAWTNSEIDPENICFIEAHGTGTVLGDPIEFKGLTSAFSKLKTKKCSTSSVKGQIGHLGSVAGLAGLTKLILALKNKRLYPQVGLNKINKHLDEENSVVKIQRKTEYWESNGKPRAGGVSSYGMTGTNLHFVLEEYNAPETRRLNENTLYIHALNIGGSTQNKATKVKEYLQQYLSEFVDVNLDQLCYSVNKMLIDENQYGQLILFKDYEELKVKLKKLVFDQQKKITKNKELILLIPEILERSNLTSFLKHSKHFSDLYQNVKCFNNNCQNEITECFLLHYCAINTLIASGFSVDHIIGAQRGKLLSLVLSGKIKLEEAIEKLNTSSGDLELFNSNGFIQFLNSLDVTKNYIIAVMGNHGKMADAFRQWWDSNKKNKNTTIIFPNHESDVCLEIIASYYNGGNTINFDKLLSKHLFLHNLHLPLFEPKRFWPDVKPIFATSVVPNKEHKTDAGLTRKPLELEEIITIIHAIWSEKLKVNNIDSTVDFFEIGGSSLLGLDVLQQIKNRFGTNLQYEDIFDYSTILSQAKLIKERLVSTESQLSDNKIGREKVTALINIDQRASEYDQLVLQINRLKEVSMISPKDIFITGGTGFLGVYIIKELLNKTSSNVICLVRAKDDKIATDRLIRNFRSYFPELKFNSDRLKAIKGDITQAGLDLSPSSQRLLKSVDTVYHLAANVNHFGKSDPTHNTNTQGTINMIEWSKNNNISYFNHFSTTAVASGSIDNTESINFYESDLELGQDFGRDIYPNSKFKAEKYIQDNKEHLNVNVFRIGNISGDSNNGLFQHNIEANNLYQRIKTLAGLNYYCEELLEIEFETTPVNIVSEIVIQLSLHRNDVLSTFHIFESNPFCATKIISQLERYQINLQKVDSKLFHEHIEELARNSQFSSENIIIGILKFKGNETSTQFIFQQKATKAYLDKIGINYTYDIDKYAESIVNYCFQKDFIKQLG